jgi:serine/threonine-protein kinase
VFFNALAKDPTHRFGRCRDFATALDQRAGIDAESDRSTEAGFTVAASAAGQVIKRDRLPSATAQQSDASAPSSSPPTMRSRPTATPSAPSPPAPKSSNAKIWVSAALAAVASVALVLLAVKLIPGHTDSGPNAPQASTEPTASDSSPPAEQTSTPTSTLVPPPWLLQEPDQSGDTRCIGGYLLSDGHRVGPAPPRPDGTYTSCAFAIAVGQKYVANNPFPNAEPQTVVAYSPDAACPSTGSTDCTGNGFNMHCAIAGTEQWITCRGGSGATVYIF